MEVRRTAPQIIRTRTTHPDGTEIVCELRLVHPRAIAHPQYVLEAETPFGGVRAGPMEPDEAEALERKISGVDQCLG